METKQAVDAENKPSNVYARLQRARAMLSLRSLKKSGFNNYGKYHYYELGDFIPHVNEILDKVGLVSIFNIDAVNRVAELLIVNSDQSEQTILFSMPLPGKKEAISTASEPETPESVAPEPVTQAPLAPEPVAPAPVKPKYNAPTKSSENNFTQQIQTLGSANTYLKRYLYLNALEIAESDSIDRSEVTNFGSARK